MNTLLVHQHKLTTKNACRRPAERFGRKENRNTASLEENAENAWYYLPFICVRRQNRKNVLQTQRGWAGKYVRNSHKVGRLLVSQCRQKTLTKSRSVHRWSSQKEGNINNYSKVRKGRLQSLTTRCGYGDVSWQWQVTTIKKVRGLEKRYNEIYIRKTIVNIVYFQF